MHTVVLGHQQRRFTCWCTHAQSEIGGDSYKRVVILLHGFPDNNDTFMQMWPGLEARLSDTLVVAPLMRGYEPSSQGPRDEYHVYQLAQDVKAWIEAVNPRNLHRVHLVGHDWGAVVAFKTASKYPHLVASMVTLAIPYLTNLSWWQLVWYAPRQLWCLSYMLRMQARCLYTGALADPARPGYLERLWRAWSPGWDFGAATESVRRSLSQPGVLDAVTAYYRQVIPWTRLEEARWPVDFLQVPTLILGGVQDGCMLRELFDLEARLLAATANVRVQLVHGVGHFLHREDPASVGDLICEWLERHP